MAYTLDQLAHTLVFNGTNFFPKLIVNRLWSKTMPDWFGRKTKKPNWIFETVPNYRYPTTTFILFVTNDAHASEKKLQDSPPTGGKHCYSHCTYLITKSWSSRQPEMFIHIFISSRLLSICLFRVRNSFIHPTFGCSNPCFLLFFVSPNRRFCWVWTCPLTSISSKYSSKQPPIATLAIRSEQIDNTRLKWWLVWVPSFIVASRLRVLEGLKWTFFAVFSMRVDCKTIFTWLFTVYTVQRSCKNWWDYLSITNFLIFSKLFLDFAKNYRHPDAINSGGVSKIFKNTFTEVLFSI